uniref:Serpentine receptor class gamma n=1 Tax=Rhabditophanes sp. KR3021 TaxID=114890 RepID=A0AC35U8L3_9BILA
MALALNIYTVLLFIIDLFSTILYVLLLIFLIKMLATKNSKITKHFFSLFVMNGLFNLLFVFEEYLTFRIPRMKLFQTFYLIVLPSMNLPGKILALNRSLEMLLSLFSVNIAFNRFSSIYWPMYYSVLWSNFKLFMLMMWPFTICIPYFLYLMQFFVTLELDSSIEMLNFVTPNTTVAEEIINISKQEIMLTKFSITNFAVALCIAFINILIIFAEMHNLNILYEICIFLFFITKSVFTFFAPYTLLILSNEIRMKFFTFIGFKQTQIDKSSVNTVKSVII